MPSKADEMLNEIEGESKNIVVSELIVQHRAAIDELKALVAPVNPGAGDGVYCLYDDLFFLRYILSFNTAAKAQIAVEATIRHRALPASQAMIRSVKTGEFIRSPVFAKMAKYQVAGPLPDEAQISGGPCILIRASMGDPDGLFFLLVAFENERGVKLGFVHRFVREYHACGTARSKLHLPRAKFPTSRYRDAPNGSSGEADTALRHDWLSHDANDGQSHDQTPLRSEREQRIVV